MEQLKLKFDLQRFAEGPESQEAEGAQEQSTDASANQEAATHLSVKAPRPP